MQSHMIDRMHRLAATIEELKNQVRTAMAREMAHAVGSAVRDVLVVSLLNRLANPPVSRTPTKPPLSTYSGGWRDERTEGRERGEHWEEERDDDERERGSDSRSDRDRDLEEDREEVEENPSGQTATAVAVGVNVGRWWLARKGTLAAAIGAGILATALGLAGGPIARAALAVLAAASDILRADSALS